jgi:phenylpyruvate tautomerase PptA (4-oxalocrotonate tautomerase family)
MIDLTYPAGSLSPAARADAVDALTAALLRCEGAPDNERTRALTWVFVHELPEGAINVGGRPFPKPVYRAMVTVPEGTMLHGPGPFGVQSRRQLVREVTDILLAAEGTETTPRDEARVQCLVREITDGYWGGLGTTFRMEDIASIAAPEAGDTPLAMQARETIDQVVLGDRLVATS